MNKEWIPITDEHKGPENPRRCWITRKDGSVEIVFFHKNYYNNIPIPTSKEITAYIPLEKPEPYKSPKEFKMGDKVKGKYSNIVILVTGEGREMGVYPRFAGVVIKENDPTWKLGQYSETWNTEAFEKIE